MIPMRQSTATDQNKLLVDDLSAPVALTKKGTPCSRKVKQAGTRCFQHEGKPAAEDPQ